LPFVTVMTLAWSAGNTFTSFAFLIGTVALIAVAASFDDRRVTRGSLVETIAGALLAGLGWTYPHFLDGGSWTRYLYAAEFPAARRKVRTLLKRQSRNPPQIADHRGGTRVAPEGVRTVLQRTRS